METYQWQKLSMWKAQLCFWKNQNAWGIQSNTKETNGKCYFYSFIPTRNKTQIQIALDIQPLAHPNIPQLKRKLSFHWKTHGKWLSNNITYQTKKCKRYDLK